MNENKFEYKVYSPAETLLMQANSPYCRYAPDIERGMLNSGYKIVLNGKRLTKKSIEK